ncbi:MAG: FAD-dependent oxidoreductase [Desulfobacterales bacterium]|nr:MAG: FAD-dependent oxidoreductase [Desulfobacterales bacterium]
MPYSRLFESFKVRNLVIPNRILMAPMGNNLSGADGIVTPRTRAYYLERARGGVGMIITEAVAVNLTGRHRAGSLCLFDSAHEDGMRRLVEDIHHAGSKVAIQLNHAGRLVDPEVSAGRVVGPSEIPALLGKALPSPLSVREIQETVSDFARAAQMAVVLGFDAVEIHGAHGYLIHQFFSPRSNQRKDQYGGSLKGRMRFSLEIVKSVRQSVGNHLPIIFRISAEEYEEGGYSLAEAISLGKALRDAGVDILHVSAGTTERPQSSLYTIQPQALPEGCLIQFAEKFRKEVGPPVIGVGRIASPEFAERLLMENRVDLVASGRGLLADPQWPKKAAGKTKGPIRRCLACNRCVETITNQNPIVCCVNPLTGNEARFPLKKASRPKKIVLVGAGPAGLEAACTAAALGHRVSLYEKESRIGGQLWDAAVPPNKALLQNLIKYYESRLAQSDVEVHLEEEFTQKTLQGQTVDAVILATGSCATRPSIPGVNQPHVLTARDVLADPSTTGERIVVVGGGWVGCETAEFLAHEGKTVRLIEMLDDIALDAEPRTRILLLQRLARLGIEITTGCKLKSIGRDDIAAEVEGRELKIPVDTVVLAVGCRANTELEIKLKAGHYKVYTIGDCRDPANIKEAVHQGFRVICECLETDD